MTSRPKSGRVESLVEGLASVDQDPNSEESKRRIREALTHKHWMPVAHASQLVAQHSLAGFTQELVDVWDRFVDPGPKLDPGCRAKEAALVALDALEWFDPEPFLRAIRHRQLEPGHGGATDTAGGVRQRALFALLRQHHSRAMLYAGELLADTLVEVRVGTAEAICHYAGPQGAALLVHRLRVGDDTRVLLACASSLLELEGSFARDLLREWLHHSDPEYREVAALALGQNKSNESGELLIAWFDEMTWDGDLELATRALALHRSERARRCLLHHLATGSRARAQAALLALAAHRYDQQLWQQAIEAAQRNPDETIAALLRRMDSR